MRGALVRSLAVLGIGLAVLAAILYYASTVDGRDPLVERIALTQHAAGDDRLALSTATIEVTFSEAVKPETAEPAFAIEPAVDGEFSWAGTTMTFTPTQRMPLETDFRVTVAAGVEDQAGNAMAEAPPPFEFRTVGAPTVIETEPADGADVVALDSAIVITFSTLMDTASVEGALSMSPGLTYEANWSGEQLTLQPEGQLEEGTRYSVTVDDGARDATGTALAQPFRFSFRTTRTPLAADRLVPADGTDGVAMTTPIAVFFDTEIDPESVSGEILSFEPDLAGSLDLITAPGAAGMRDPGRSVLRFQPSAALAPNTTYRVTLARGLAGVDGAQLVEPIEWSFTTGSGVTTLSNQIVFLSDRAGVSNLWAMNPDGSVQRQVSAELSPVIDYAVSPDGRRVLLSDGAVLVLQDASGSSRTVLTEPGALEYDPAWAPDGSRFVFGRSDRETAEGQGLWTRGVDGGDPAPVRMPGESQATPTASPGPSGSAAGELLRVPRYSPDGSALAFVDTQGGVAVLELPNARLTTARFVAVGPPVWLRDSSAVLVSGRGSGPLDRPEAGEPMPPFDPRGLRLPPAERTEIGLVRMERAGSTVQRTALPGGASRPAVSIDRLIYVLLDPASPVAAGELWLADGPISANPERRLLDDGGAAVESATFGLDGTMILAAREDDGIWLVDVGEGDGEQISDDGRLPRWLP